MNGRSDLRGLSCAVIGGGIGGMAFAMRAAALGCRVVLIEADPDWRVAGAGISITGPTYRALKRLGVLDEVLSQGFFIEVGARLCAPDGHVVGEVPMTPIEPGLPTAGGIMRPALHNILSRRVRDAGVDVRLGARVTAIASGPDGATLAFGDGSTLETDFVVGADGAFSQVRSMAFPDAPEPAYTGQYCWRMVAERPAEIDRPTFFVGARVTAGLMPCSDKLMYLWLLEASDERRHIDDDKAGEQLRDLLGGFGGALGALREVIGPDSGVNSRPLDALILPKPWHAGRTVLIGDAAHATTPHLASGAGIAIEDALVLSDALVQSPDLEHAFASFTERRWERCRLVVESSVAIGRMQREGASPDKLNALMFKAQKALAEEV